MHSTVNDLLYAGEGLPPFYQSNVAQNDRDSVGLSEIKKISNLETFIQKNSQKMEELAFNFRKQFDTMRRLFDVGFKQGIQQGLSEKKMTVTVIND